MSDIKNKRVNIYIDQTAAEAALVTLQKRADSLNKTIAAGRTEGKNMASELAKLKDVTSSIKEIQDQIDKGLRPSFAQQNTLVTKLRNELKRMSEDAPGYAEKFKSYMAATAEFNRMRDAINGLQKAQSSWFEQAKIVAFGVLIGNTVQQAISSISNYLSGIVTGNAKLSDSLADLRRVSGLTVQEADDLNKKLSKIDTRTSLSGLREIAIIAAKLGVAKEDIAGFTKSVDQLVVALGDELGSADQITTQLGKILNVFDGNVNGDNILKLGNSFVVLANAGVATGGFIADFTQRVSGIAKASGISLGATVGLAAGLEELGGKVESSATAIQKLITTIGNDIPKAAKIAGATTKEQIQQFANLFASAPQEALLKYAEGLTKNKKAFSEIAATFKDAGEEGARVVGTLLNLGQKADFFREKIDLGKKSLESTSAITGAFALKNETLGASLEKLGKNIARYFTNSTLVSFFDSFIKGAEELTSKTKSATEQFDKQVSSVLNLVTNIEPLLGRYEELKTKTTLSKDEQAEMKKIIDQVVGVVPGAVTAFDNYGNAIAISTDRVRGFIVAEKARLLVTNSDAIRDNQKKLEEIERQIAAKKIDLDQIAKTGSFTVETQSGAGISGGGGVSTRQANAQEIADAEEKFKELKNLQLGYQSEIKRLNGDALQEAIDAQKKQADLAAAELKKKPPVNVAILDNTDNSDRDAFLKKLRDFQFELEQVGRTHDESEIQRISKKYNEITKEAAQYGANVIELEKAKNRAIAFLIDDEAKKRTEAAKKEFTELVTKEYQVTQVETIRYFENLKDLQAQDFVNKVIDKKQYEANIAQIDLAAKQAQLRNAQDYSANVKQAQSDVTKYTKQSLEEQVAATIAANAKKLENEKLTEDLRKKGESARLSNIVKNTEPGTAGYAKAQADVLLNEKRNELAAIDKEEQEYRIKGIEDEKDFNELRKQVELKFQDEIAQIKLKAITDQINQYLQYFSSAINIIGRFAQVQSDNEKRALDKELKNNDLKKAAYKRQLDNKVISQQEYQQKINALDAEAQKKQDALDKKQFERNKKIQFAQAVVNGAEGITKAVSSAAWPLNIPAIIFAAATTAAELGVIASAKYAKGGIARGSKHADGGISMIDSRSGQKVGEMEDGEPYMILSGNTYLNNKGIVDALLQSSLYKNGAPIAPQYTSQAYQPIDYKGITNSFQKLKYASGGINGPDALTSLLNAQQPTVVVNGIDKLETVMNAILTQMKNPVAPMLDFSLYQLQKAQDLKARIQDDAGFK